MTIMPLCVNNTYVNFETTLSPISFLSPLIDSKPFIRILHKVLTLSVISRYFC